MAYTTESKIENYLAIDIDPSLSSQITAWINAVTNYINNYTGREDGFENTASDTKYFDGLGGTELLIGEFTSLTSVQTLETDGTTIAQTLTENSDYWAYPLNEDVKNKLVLAPNNTIALFPVGPKRIKVVGVWGRSTLPADIELAATILVSRIVEKGQRGGNVVSESLGDYSVSFQEIGEMAVNCGVKQILDMYRKFEI